MIIRNNSFDITSPKEQKNFPTTLISSDPSLSEQFHTFLTTIESTPLHLLAQTPYLKQLQEEDIDATLKFGPTSRINTKKLSESISQNACYVEKIKKRNSMTSDDGKSLHSLASMGSLGSFSSIGNLGKSSVTKGIFIKSLSERMSHFANSFQSSSPPTHSNLNPNTTNTNTSISNQITHTHSFEYEQCATCQSNTSLTHHFKLSIEPEEEWLPICTFCRNRLVSVCDIWSFIRGYKSGVYKYNEKDLFKRFVGLRKGMFYARLGVECFEGRDTGRYDNERDGKDIRRDEDDLDRNSGDVEGDSEKDVSEGGMINETDLIEESTLDERDITSSKAFVEENVKEKNMDKKDPDSRIKSDLD